MLVQSSTKKEFLNSINYFRGIAIVIIVLGHCYDIAHWQISSNSEKLLYSLTVNGSVFFVFISGYLFHHIFYSRFEFVPFIVKKIKFVVLPYIILSLPPILYQIFAQGGAEFLPTELPDHFLLAIAWYLVTGHIFFAYWYIPMAVILFAVSPLVVSLIRSNYLLSAILLLLPISLIVHRPIENLNPLHSFVYFFPVYLIGVYSSIYKTQINTYINNNKRFLGLTVIALGLIQVLVFQQSGNFHKNFWELDVIDVNLLQKIIFGYLIMAILNMYEKRNINTLKILAETSFPIYFIHPFIINIFNKIVSLCRITYEGNLLIFALISLMVILVSMATAYLIKQIFQKNSRYLIGW